MRLYAFAIVAMFLVACNTNQTAPQSTESNNAQSQDSTTQEHLSESMMNTSKNDNVTEQGDSSSQQTIAPMNTDNANTEAVVDESISKPTTDQQSRMSKEQENMEMAKEPESKSEDIKS